MSPEPTSEIGQDALTALCTEMSRITESGSQSATLSDVLMDPGAAICDGQGRVLACSSVRHLAPFSSVARACAAGLSFPVEAQSVVLLNDPFGGGTRVLDFYAIHPVEVEGAEGRWMTASRCTAADLGGNCFGGYNPTATEVWAEGARITPLRVFARGAWARETLACVTLNSRTPRLFVSQLRAMIAAVTTVGNQLSEILAELGQEPGSVAARQLDAAAELMNRSRQDGSLGGDGGPATAPVRSSAGEDSGQVTVEAQLSDGRLVLDLSGSASAAPGYTNATRTTTVSAALAVLFPADEGAAAANDVLLESVEVITQPNTIVDAVYPTPTMCAELAVAPAVRSAVSAAVGGSEPQEVLDGAILGADGRLAEGLADELRADEARSSAKGGKPWQ